MTQDLASISVCAERLGIARTTLSKLLDEAGVVKVRQGRENLVSFADAQKVTQDAAAAGKLRVKSGKGRSVNASAMVDPRESFYMDQIRAMQDEIRLLREKLMAADAVQAEVKLLKAATADKDRKIEALIDKVEELQGPAEKAIQLQKELEDLRKKVDSSLVGRAAKIRDAFLGK